MCVSLIITLTDVNQNNYEAVCDLSVTDEQDDYVAQNVWSLVESMFNPSYRTRAICLDGVPVGFFMWVPERADKISIWRFMIDQKHQNKGIGRIALTLALSEIKRNAEIRIIGISYAPENSIAKDLYTRFGFSETGIDEETSEMQAELNV